LAGCAASRWCTPAATAIRGGAIIATFWAAIIAAITAVLVGTTAALALSSVGGGLKVRIRGPAQHLLAVIIGVNLSVQVAEGNRRSLDAESRHQSVVGTTKARKDEGHMFPCRDGTTSHS
jgi:hypothetical protein